MLLFVGLGNPGNKYKTSRHNAGFLWIDSFLKYLQSNNYYSVSSEYYDQKNLYCMREVRSNIQSGGDLKALILKPLTFMNLSGSAVASIVNKYKIPSQNIYIAHDDLDLKLGDFKISFGKYPKTHNGIKSIHQNLGKADLWYIRLGIDNRDKVPQYKFIPPADYVLLPLTAEELDTLKEAISASIKQLWEVLKGEL